MLQTSLTMDLRAITKVSYQVLVKVGINYETKASLSYNMHQEQNVNS